MSIKIMIDSASDFTENKAKELGMILMPISVQIDGEEYLDGVDLFAEQFYDKLETCKNLPQTSLINQYTFEQAFEKETQDGSQIIVITISSKLSGTYNAAVNASKKFTDKVFVVDSLNAAFAEGVLGIYAVNLREQGLNCQEILEKLNEKKNDIRVYALVDTLKYLKKGGRISAATAIIGTTLSIKPIVGVVDGEVKMVGKAIGNKRGNLMLNSIIESSGGVDLDMPYGYIWSGKDRTNIDKYIKDSNHLIQGKPSSLNILGCTIGTHVGAGAVGLVYFKKN